MAKRKGGLGRGLDALFADAAPVIPDQAEEDLEARIDSLSRPAEKPSAAVAKANDSDEDRVLYIDIDDIKPNPSQPRKSFDREKLQD